MREVEETWSWATVGIIVTLLLAGCTAPTTENTTDPTADLGPGNGADTGTGSTAEATNLHDLGQAPNGAQVTLTGFVTFPALHSGLQTIYPDTTSDTPANIQAQLPSDHAWTLGLFLEESFITEAEDPERLVREHGAVIALPAFTERQDRIHHVNVTGQAFDLRDYLPGQREGAPGHPLIIADAYELLAPETFDLPTLHEEFETITGDHIATHTGTVGYGFGTTLQHVEEAAAEAEGEEPQEHPLDVGIYDLFDATYLPASTNVETFHLPVVTLTRNKGQELLGDHVRVEGFLVSEEQLGQEAQERVPELRTLAETWTDLRTASNELAVTGSQELDNPILSRVVEETQDRAANQHRIPGYLLAYKITPHEPAPFHTLQELAKDPYPEEDLLAHVQSEGYLTGTTAETVCKAANKGECELPYDLGIYHLVNVTIGDDHLPTFTQAPVVYPANTIPPQVQAAVATPVRVDGVWVQESLLRDDIHNILQRHTDDPAFAEVFLEDDASRPFSDRIKTLDGFLYAREIRLIPALHDLPPPVLLYQEDETEDDAELAPLRWTTTFADDFDRYEVHQSHTPRFQPTEQTRVATITDQEQTTHTPANLAEDGRIFKIWVFDKTNLFASSNSVQVDTAETGNGSGASVTLQDVTRCADAPASCLRVSWTADTTDGFDRFEVHRTTENSGWIVVETTQDPSDRSYRDEGLNCGTEYTYKVELYTEHGMESTEEVGQTPDGPGCY